VKHTGADAVSVASRGVADPFDVGVLVGILIGEGHFRVTGRSPEVVLRMHVRHRSLFDWLEAHVPGGRVYGPYEHAGRHYYQWMARGAFLRDVLVPLLDRHLTSDLDAHVYRRFSDMRARFGLFPHSSRPPTRRWFRLADYPLPGDRKAGLDADSLGTAAGSLPSPQKVDGMPGA
jgi:hypothetical protein